ncbi:MAG: PAS domain S-box protein [Candidatus Hydrogenedentes bacterium]|nr:PAS domain S-box protein [Candidatus Hydrogenedentota bacterium]
MSDCTGNSGGVPAAQALPAMAFAQAEFAAAITDGCGIITFVNDAFTRLTGYTPQDAIGASIEILRTTNYDDAFYADIWRRLTSGERWSDRLSVGRKDGSAYRSRSFAAPILEPDGAIAGYSFFSRDTSDEAKLEAQLGHLQKMEAIGELAAGIAHEINTPIQYIGDNIQFLLQATAGLMRLVEASAAACEAGRGAAIPPEILDGLETLRREIDWDFLKVEIPLAIEQSLEGRDRVADIVRAMKEFAHPGDEELTPLDINHAIENTLAVSRGEWKNVAAIALHLTDHLPPVHCYPSSFNQVLLNLVVNASHAIADRHGNGGKGLISISSALREDAVEVVVGDNGCGIPAEIVSRIFEPFFTTKDVGKGTGQGLALTHAVIVERMKGAIEVDSTPGEGTRFLLRLPLGDPQNTQGTEEAQET